MSCVQRMEVLVQPFGQATTNSCFAIVPVLLPYKALEPRSSVQVGHQGRRYRSLFLHLHNQASQLGVIAEPRL